MKDRPTAIDLFCGAGGLTLGLKKAGFNVVVGVEANRKIVETYASNHPETKLLMKDVREVTGKEILRLAGRSGIDLIAGCPPCQGFSQLTEKYKRPDARNDLVLEIARLIEEICPRMVMMENVAGITTKGKPLLDQFMSRLKNLGYEINEGVLQMADYGVPQSRRRFVLMAGNGFLIPLPQPTHSSKGNYKKRLRPWVVVADVIKKMPKPVKLSHALQNGGPQKFNWHVVKDLREISIQRLKAISEGDGRMALPRKLRPKCHKTRNSGFPNVYGRLAWNKVSSTITSGCTTPSMGRFGHPDEDRTISVREAALLQTFPRSYQFRTNFMDTACDLVGNALPYLFARKAAETCLTALKERKGGRNA